MGDILELKGAIPLKIVNEEIKSGVERVGGCLPGIVKHVIIFLVSDSFTFLAQKEGEYRAV
jgi:hypothetical protein